MIIVMFIIQSHIQGESNCVHIHHFRPTPRDLQGFSPSEHLCLKCSRLKICEIEGATRKPTAFCFEGNGQVPGPCDCLVG